MSGLEGIMGELETIAAEGKTRLEEAGDKERELFSIREQISGFRERYTAKINEVRTKMEAGEEIALEDAALVYFEDKHEFDRYLRGLKFPDGYEILIRPAIGFNLGWYDGFLSFLTALDQEVKEAAEGSKSFFLSLESRKRYEEEEGHHELSEVKPTGELIFKPVEVLIRDRREDQDYSIDMKHYADKIQNYWIFKPTASLTL